MSPSERTVNISAINKKAAPCNYKRRREISSVSGGNAYASFETESTFGIQTRRRGSRGFTTFEDILKASGGFGLFQYLVLILLLLVEIPAAFVTFSPVFTGRFPSIWTCTINETVYEISFKDICKCNGELQSPESSIISEWNLVCGYQWVSDFMTSLQMLGMLVGSLLASQISDWYGRKRVYLGVCIIMAVGQVLSGLAPNPYIFGFARFLAGAGIAGMMGMTVIYSMEFLTTEDRLLTGCLSPWGEGIILFSWMSSRVPLWRNLMFYSSIPFIIPLITVPFIPESPQWLLRHGKIDEALRVIHKIQRINRKEGLVVTEELLREMISDENNAILVLSESEEMTEKQRYSYLDFFRDSECFQKTLLLMGIWFGWSLIYYGISYNINNMPGNLHQNVGFMGLADAVGYPAALLITNRLGRRKSLIIFVNLAATLLVSLAIADLFYPFRLNGTLVVALCLTGKLWVSAARAAARTLTSESFPTSMRTMGYGITGMFAGLGGIVAPQIVFIGSLCWAPLPFLTFAVISVIGSFLALLLPETAGKALT